MRLQPLLAGAILLSSCATQAPYTSPPISLPPAWANAAKDDDAAKAERFNASDARWWKGLQDPAIDVLVAAALTDNPTLAEVAARVDQAKAVVAVERAHRSPRIDITGSAASARAGSPGSQAGQPTTIAQNSATIEPILSWEIDLWGRVRESGLAARSRLQAREADAAGARLSVASQVADGVLTLRACNLLLDVRTADIASRENELVIIRTRVRLGNLAPTDAAAAESNLIAVRIDRIAQEEACRRTIDALVALSGRPPAEVRSILSTPLGTGDRVVSEPSHDGQADLFALMPSAPEAVPGLPAVILLAHPSVVAAEREVAARWAEIAVARAERLPRLDLTAILTGQWIRSLGSTSSLLTGSIGAGLSGPLIDGGVGRAEIVGADARYREAVATLNATLRQAVRDIEDGLAAQDSAVRRVEASRSALIAARLTLRGNEARRRAGSIGAFELEDSRRQLNRAQESAIIAARDRARAWIELIQRSGTINATIVTESAAPAFASVPSLGAQGHLADSTVPHR